ncbi:MAG: hypothetical protein EHM13_07100, partial [Acidobacteria bacterium]
MSWSVFVRAVFVAAVTIASALIQPLPSGVLINVGFGLVVSGIAILIELRMRQAALTRVLGGLIGGVIGLVIGEGLEAALVWADANDGPLLFVRVFLMLFLPYLGLVIGVRRGEWLEPSRLIALFRGAGPERRYKILDTSVIIDGRIADVCETGFID